MATIRKRGNKWHVQIRRAGTQSINRSFLRRSNAEEWAREVELAADRRELPKDHRELQRHTLTSLVERYRDTVSIRKRGHADEKIVLNAFLRHPLCHKKLSEIASADFAKYRDQRLQTIKATTLKREFSTLHHIFEVARGEWELPIRNNPVAGVSLPCPCNRRERRLEIGELERILQAAKETRNPLVVPIILLALETGLRRSDLLRATWMQLNLAKRLLSLPKPKNGHSRVVPLSVHAIEVLTHLKQALGAKAKDSERIFDLTPNAFRLAWERLIERAGIRDLHFHDLRHEAISRFFELGLAMPEVALLSGHRDVRMLFRYSHAQHQRILNSWIGQESNVTPDEVDKINA
ncbi:MAG: site-specific integrase [Hyphomicrobiales bacterium]